MCSLLLTAANLPWGDGGLYSGSATVKNKNTKCQLRATQSILNDDKTHSGHFNRLNLWPLTSCWTVGVRDKKTVSAESSAVTYPHDWHETLSVRLPLNPHIYIKTPFPSPRSLHYFLKMFRKKWNHPGKDFPQVQGIMLPSRQLGEAQAEPPRPWGQEQSDVENKWMYVQ